MMNDHIALYLDNVLNRAKKSKKQTVNLSDEEMKAIQIARAFVQGKVQKPIR